MGTPRPGWGWLVPLTAAFAGLLFVATAVTAGGSDLRASRSLQLSQLVTAEQQDVARLTARERALSAVVAAETRAAGQGNADVARLSAQAAALAAPVGLGPVSGPGVTVTLNDAPQPPAGVTLPGNPTPDDLVVHQQDVQAVLNALWSGGATAIQLMDQRVVGLTAVLCVGSTLLLHERVYSPPYVVTAVGNPARLIAALDAEPYIQLYREYVALYGLGYTVAARAYVRVAGYTGPLVLVHAAALP